MLTLQNTKSYLKIDFDEDDELIKSLMKTADEYLKSAISNTYNSDTERAKLLSLIIVQDLYDNRGITEKVSGNVRKLIFDFTLQLKLESGIEDA